MICLKTSFYKNVNRKGGVNYMCEICMKKYIKEYMKNRITRKWRSESADPANFVHTEVPTLNLRVFSTML